VFNGQTERPEEQDLKGNNLTANSMVKAHVEESSHDRFSESCFHLEKRGMSRG
jgi:hypothetical protein